MRRALLLALAAACGGHGPTAPAAPTAPVVADRRPLELIVDGQWLGDGICYGPHRDGQRPGGADPTTDQLREDLTLLAPRWRLLRIYSADDLAGRLLELIRTERPRLRVLLGAWISGDPAADQRQVDAAIALANAYPDVVIAVVVGNETQVSWSDHKVDQAVLIDRIRAVRRQTKVAVATADDFGFWLGPDSDRLAAELDVAVLHVHPMWNGQALAQAVAFTRDRRADVIARHPGLPIFLGETGWATAVAGTGEQARLIKGEASDAAQAGFFAELTAWTTAARVPVTYFEAFDETWKGGPAPDEVEKHWGLFRADRTAKPALPAMDTPAR